jgi:hypothetical protein
MANPNCSKCSKAIPGGFTDCPWCGATQASSGAEVRFQDTASTPSPLPFFGPDALTGLALLLSLGLLFGFSFLSILRDNAANPLANPAYFRGEWIGTYFWAVVILTIFALIRGRRVRSSVKFLSILGPGFLLGLMILGKPLPHLAPDPAQFRRAGEVIKNSGTVPLDKWDLAVRPFYIELISRNRQYVAEVSKLDDALQPLYSPASFRDAKSIQAMLDALDQRLVIVDKYAGIQPLLAKVPEYVANVDATEWEKRQFMAGFKDSTAKSFSAKNSVAALEHKWVVSAIDLYKFALSHQGAYSYSPGNVLFKNVADFTAFNEKRNKSRELYSQFLKAYTASRRAQDVLLAQMGLQRSDIGLENSK